MRTLAAVSLTLVLTSVSQAAVIAGVAQRSHAPYRAAFLIAQTR